MRRIPLFPGTRSAVRHFLDANRRTARKPSDGAQSVGRPTLCGCFDGAKRQPDVSFLVAVRHFLLVPFTTITPVPSHPATQQQRQGKEHCPPGTFCAYLRLSSSFGRTSCVRQTPRQIRPNTDATTEVFRRLTSLPFGVFLFPAIMSALLFFLGTAMSHGAASSLVIATSRHSLDAPFFWARVLVVVHMLLPLLALPSFRTASAAMELVCPPIPWPSRLAVEADVASVADECADCPAVWVNEESAGPLAAGNGKGSQMLGEEIGRRRVHANKFVM